MSWSAIVNDIQNVNALDNEVQEYFASQHASYPRDAQLALELAKKAGLRSATISGMRAPNPYGGDEIVDISVRGTPIYKDFLLEMREIIASGPGEDSDLARHYAALARLRERPCSHVFDDLAEFKGIPVRRCLACKVYLAGTMFFFEDDT